MKARKATPRRGGYFTAAVLFFTLLLGATGQGLAAEIEHFYQSYDAIIKLNCANSVWKEVTQYQIASSNFTPGKQYLLVINFSTSVNNGAYNSMARVLHGTTVFPDSTFMNETRRGGVAHCGHAYSYWTVWTAVSGQDIHVEISQSGTVGTNVRTEEYEAFAINLEDGLTENADWFYQTETHSGNLPTTWGTFPGIGASVTFDGGNDDWMILGFGRFLSDATSNQYKMRIYDVNTTLNYCQTRHATEDINDYRPHMIIAGIENVGSNHTVRVEATNHTANTNDWTNSKIFALNLNKFKDHWIGYSTAGVSPVVLDTWYEVYGKPDYSASQTGDVLIWSQEIQDTGDNAKSTYSRMTVNGAVVPAGHSDAKRELPHGANDEDAHHRIYLGSLNVGSNDIDIDMNEDVDVSPAAVVDIHSLVIFSMAKVTSCPAPGTPNIVNPADLATGVPITQVLDWTDCVDTDTYAVYLDENPSPTTKVGEPGVSTFDPDLGYCTHYYWKIVAKNAGGCSTVSDVWEFTTVDGPPGTPSNPSPADGAVDVSATGDLDWSDCSGTDTYEVYLDENPTPTTKVGETTDSTYSPALGFGTQYYWKIVAKNSCGYSTAGPVWNFTTGSGTTHYVDKDSTGASDPYQTQGTAATSIQTAINACTVGTVYVKKASGTYNQKINMKSDVHVVGTNATWGVPSSRNDYPTVDRTTRATVRFLGPLTNSRLSYFKITGGKMEEGQIYISGKNGEIGNDVIIEHCWLNQGSHVGIQLKGPVAPTIRDCDIEDPRTSCISSFLYGIESASTPMIIQGCDLSGLAGYGDGWGLRAGISLVGENGGNVDAIIGGDGALANHIHDMGRAGIRLKDLGAGCDITIDNNEIDNNSDGQYNLYAPGILVDNVGKVTIKRNTIHDNMQAGIAIANNSDVTIGAEASVTAPIADIQSQYGNDIYGNYSGVAFGRKKTAPSNGTFVIRGNQIYTNRAGLGGGIAITREVAGTVLIKQNEIYDNQRAGIGIQDDCTAEIVQNHIYNQYQRAGIHTGRNGPNWFGGDGGAVLTIRQNKIHGNSNVDRGGGIDVRHASGTIENNLVYDNRKGGIRFGDWIDEIVNNTVVNNGNDTNDQGGGIIYDDLAGGVMDPPDGVPPAPLLILNNISAYNHKAGIRACFDNTEGSEERDYNLLYANYPWNSAFSRSNSEDCGWPDLDDMSCIKQQYGGCVAYFVKGVGILLDDPNDIVADPMFVSITPGSEDFHLQVGSPAINAGDDGDDMGAYGGIYYIDDSEIP